jgi:hypothetical protein
LKISEVFIFITNMRYRPHFRIARDPNYNLYIYMFIWKSIRKKVSVKFVKNPSKTNKTTCTSAFFVFDRFFFNANNVLFF